MLHGKHRRRHQHGDLLAVGGCLEGGANRYLSLAETDIATYQTIHRLALLHICLDSLCGSHLVGSVFVDETCLQFMLKIGVGSEGMPLQSVASCIERDQFARHLFHLLFGALFHPVPRAPSKFADLRRYPLFTSIFREFVESMDRH